MIRRRQPGHGNGEPGEGEFRPTPEQVEELTQRASRLLDELHDVLGEMAERLTTLSAGGK